MYHKIRCHFYLRQDPFGTGWTGLTWFWILDHASGRICLLVDRRCAYRRADQPPGWFQNLKSNSPVCLLWSRFHRIILWKISSPLSFAFCLLGKQSFNYWANNSYTLLWKTFLSDGIPTYVYRTIPFLFKIKVVGMAVILPYVFCTLPSAISMG